MGMIRYTLTLTKDGFDLSNLEAKRIIPISTVEEFLQVGDTIRVLYELFWGGERFIGDYKIVGIALGSNYHMQGGLGRMNYFELRKEGEEIEEDFKWQII